MRARSAQSSIGSNYSYLGGWNAHRSRSRTSAAEEASPEDAGELTPQARQLPRLAGPAAREGGTQAHDQGRRAQPAYHRAGVAAQRAEEGEDQDEEQQARQAAGWLRFLRWHSQKRFFKKLLRRDKNSTTGSRSMRRSDEQKSAVESTQKSTSVLSLSWRRCRKSPLPKSKETR